MFSFSHNWLLILGLKSWFVNRNIILKCSNHPALSLGIGEKITCHLTEPGSVFLLQADFLSLYEQSFILILHVHIEDEGVGKAVFTFSLLIPLREADVV